MQQMMVSWPGAIELLRTSIVFEAIVLTVVAGDEDQCGSNLIPKLAYREETLRSSRRSLHAFGKFFRPTSAV